MTTTIATILIAVAIIVASKENIWAQGVSNTTSFIVNFQAQMPEPSAKADNGQRASDIIALLKNLPTMVPELPQAQVQVHGNTWMATYNIMSASPKMVGVLMPIEIQVASYALHEEADQGVRMKIHIASIAPTETQTSGGVVVYRWKTQGLSRTLSRCGSYVVDVSGRPSSDLAVNKAFDVLTKQIDGR